MIKYDDVLPCLVGRTMPNKRGHESSADIGGRLVGGGGIAPMVMARANDRDSRDVRILPFGGSLESLAMPKRFVPWNCKGISGLRRWCVLHPLCSKVDAIRSHRYRSRRAHARSFSCCRCNCWWSSCEHHFRRRAEGDVGLRRWYATVSCASENGRARCTDLGVAFGTDLTATGIRA